MTEPEKMYHLERLVRIMATLRAPGGCPWDALQTPESLRRFLVEETYEVLEAIDSGQPDAICEELGDLLLQIVFHARIFEERGEFDIDDVAKRISDKLVRRHPHVFEKDNDTTPETLALQWERIKAEETRGKASRKPPLEMIPPGLPALLRARKVVEKAVCVTHEALEPSSLLTQVEEDFLQMKMAASKTNAPRMEEQMGRFLLSLVQLGASQNIDAEDCLRQAIDSYIRRFGQEKRTGEPK